SPDPQRALVLCPVRARGYGRAHPGQNRRLEEEGPVDGRPARAWLRRQGQEADHERGGGRNGTDDLSPISRTRLGPRIESLARCGGHRQQAENGRGRERLWRPRLLTWRALSDAAEPGLLRRDRPQRGFLSWRAPCDRRRGSLAQGST